MLFDRARRWWTTIPTLRKISWILSSTRKWIEGHPADTKWSSIQPGESIFSINLKLSLLIEVRIKIINWSLSIPCFQTWSPPPSKNLFTLLSPVLQLEKIVDTTLRWEWIIFLTLFVECSIAKRILITRHSFPWKEEYSKERFGGNYLITLNIIGKI